MLPRERLGLPLELLLWMFTGILAGEGVTLVLPNVKRALESLESVLLKLKLCKNFDIVSANSSFSDRCFNEVANSSTPAISLPLITFSVIPCSVSDVSTLELVGVQRSGLPSVQKPLVEVGGVVCRFANHTSVGASFKPVKIK